MCGVRRTIWPWLVQPHVPLTTFDHSCAHVLACVIFELCEIMFRVIILKPSHPVYAFRNLSFPSTHENNKFQIFGVTFRAKKRRV
jgi:hypothetical protein